MLANVEIIENPKESIDHGYDISISAKEELLLAFPMVNSFLRNVRTGMSMQLLKEEYSKNNVILNTYTHGQPNYADNRGIKKGFIPT
jgi:hypothetical protein